MQFDQGPKPKLTKCQLTDVVPSIVLRTLRQLLPGQAGPQHMHCNSRVTFSGSFPPPTSPSFSRPGWSRSPLPLDTNVHLRIQTRRCVCVMENYHKPLELRGRRSNRAMWKCENVKIVPHITTPQLKFLGPDFKIKKNIRTPVISSALPHLSSRNTAWFTGYSQGHLPILAGAQALVYFVFKMLSNPLVTLN